MDATKGMSNEQIMKQIIKDATKGLKGEEKEKVIRDLFVKVMPKPKGMTDKTKTSMPTKKMAAAKGGMSTKKKMMGGGYSMKTKKKMMGGGYSTKKKK